MKTYLDCYACFLRRALEAACMAGADENRQYSVLQEVLAELRQFELTSTPPEMAYRIHDIVRREMGAHDPYQEAKAVSTRQALALYPRLKALVAEADDPLETASPIFFLLQAKCPLIARSLGVPVTSIVLKDGTFNAWRQLSTKPRKDPL